MVFVSLFPAPPRRGRASEREEKRDGARENLACVLPRLRLLPAAVLRQTRTLVCDSSRSTKGGCGSGRRTERSDGRWKPNGDQSKNINGRVHRQKKQKNLASPSGADARKSQHSVFFSSGRFPGSEPTLNSISTSLSLSLSPSLFPPSIPTGAGHQDNRRASAHVERDNSGFDLSGLSGGGSGVGGGGGAAGCKHHRRAPPLHVLPSLGSLHGPEMLANDEDNELFMSDEFQDVLL